ncbi:hypothetical protein Sros01_68260 [Streptomyces roseochromogenus]|nr:hypothetical protein Sros01_68260 [Streptomyces roseochromogenus]
MESACLPVIRRAVRSSAVRRAGIAALAHGTGAAVLRLAPALLTPWVLRAGVPSAGWSWALVLLLSAAAVAAAHAAARQRDAVWTRLLDRLQQLWERRVWRGLMRLPSSVVRAEPRARLLDQAGTPARCRRAVGMASPDTLLTPVCTCLALMVLAAVTPWLGCVLLAAFGVLAALVTLLHAAAGAEPEPDHDAQALLRSALSGADELWAYGSMPAVLGKWQRAQELRRTARARARRYDAWCEGLLHGSVWWFAGAVAAAAAMPGVEESQLLVGMLAVAPLSAALSRYGQALPAALGARAALLAPPLDRRNAARPARREQLQTDGSARHELVRLRNASYAYPDAPEPVLRDISLTVHSNDSIVLVGPSGSGKTTLLRLLLGLEDPTTGTATHAWEPGGGALRIAYVAQDERPGAADLGTFLAGDEYAAQKERILETAEVVGLGGLLGDLPMGLKTPASNLGAHVATGQWQRLLLARALLKDPHVLVLDEALSALDPLSRRQISDRLGNRAMTRVTVTHDRHTIGTAHRVLALDGDGRLVHDGPPGADAPLHGPGIDLTGRR